MGIVELLILAVGVSMDAFAVSICRGVKLRNVTWKHSLEAGVYFGGFQALMPVIGYFMGEQFYEVIKDYDHWVTFILLGILGFNMLKEAFEKEEASEEPEGQSMLLLAIATSIDALAVGVSLALLQMNIFTAALFIGVITFWFSTLGVKIGANFGDKYKSKAEVLGGIILIGLGVKILLEHIFL